MNPNDQELSPEEHKTVKMLGEAYQEDEALPEELAKARAIADVNHQAGRTDDTFDAKSNTVTSGEDG
jgi:hypothetical protein